MSIVPTGTFITTEGQGQPGFRGYHTRPPNYRIFDGEIRLERYGTYRDWIRLKYGDANTFADEIVPRNKGYRYTWCEYKTLKYERQLHLLYSRGVKTTFNTFRMIRKAQGNIVRYPSETDIINKKLNEVFEFTKKSDSTDSRGFCSVVLTKKNWGKTRAQYRADVLKALNHQHTKGNITGDRITLMGIFDSVSRDTFLGIP